MARSVKYRENTIAFVLGIFAGLAAGTGAAILYMVNFVPANLSILQMVGVGLCILLMILFFFQAFKQAFWSGLGGFVMVLVGVLALAGVLFLPEMLAKTVVDLEVDPQLTETPTVMITEVEEIAPETEEVQPAGCLVWSDVNNDLVDQEICVYGELVKVYSSEGASFMLFTDETGGFFLLAYNWGDASLKGRCVQTTGVVKRLGTSPVIVVGQKEDLEFCD